MNETNPYAAPSANLTSTDQSVDKFYEGLGRGPYFGLALVSVIAFGVVVAMMTAISADAGTAGRVFLFIFAAFVIGWVYLAGRRMKNIGRSPWVGLMVLVPLANLYYGWMLLATPAGYADHGELDTTGKIVSFVYVLLLILNFAGSFLDALAPQ